MKKIIISIGVGLGLLLSTVAVLHGEDWVTQYKINKMYVAPILPLKDPVDLYFEQKLEEFKEKIKREERIVRDTLEKENAYVEYKPKYKKILDARATAADELDTNLSLLVELGLGEVYGEIATQMGIKELKNETQTHNK